MLLINIVYLLFECSVVVEVAVGTFSITPESVVQAEGLNATFFCAHPTASATGWRLNSTSVNMRKPQNVIVGTTTDGYGRSLQYLTILATADYNGTTVQCFAFVMKNESSVVENAMTVLLIVQGALNSVSNISRIPDTTNIIFTWKPPYSLNLTRIEPDVAYCIDIYNVTNGSHYHDRLISDCNVTTTQYTFNDVSHPDPRNLFRFTITPRSNIAGAKNGTPSEPMEAYFYVDPTVCANDVRIEIDDMDLELNPFFPNWACNVTITVSIWTYDDPVILVNCQCVILTLTPTTNKSCSECSRLIQRNRKYMIRVQCENDIGINESAIHYLSTHEIVNSTFRVYGDGVHFTCHFMMNSTASGCLLISQSSDVLVQPINLYKVVYKNSMDDLAIASSLQELSLGKNRLFLYEVEKTGLPGKYPAINTSVIILSKSQTNDIIPGNFNNLSLFSVVQQICISHSLQLQAGYLGCTILFHPCIFKEAWDFISVHYMNAQIQTTCFSVSVGCYSVAVFMVRRDGLMDLVPAEADFFVIGQTDAPSNTTIVLTKVDLQINNASDIALGSLLSVCILAITIMVVVWIIKYCKINRRSDSQLSVASLRPETTLSNDDVAIHLHKCEAYETVNRLPTARLQRVATLQ